MGRDAVELDDDVDGGLVIMYESVANLAFIDPKERDLYEIDCGNRLYRELSVYFTDGKRSFRRDVPSEWHHVAPQTTEANLLKIVCTKR